MSGVAVPWADELPDDVPGGWVADLRDLLRAFPNRGDLGVDLAAAVHDWVLLGDAATLPDGLEWSPGTGFGHRARAAAAALGIDPWGAPRRELRLRMTSALGDLPDAVGLRWATVLGQAVRGRAHDWFPEATLPGKAVWPYGVLMHGGLGLAGQARSVHLQRGVVPVEARTGVPAAVLDALQEAAGWPPSTLLVALLTRPDDRDAREAVDLLAAYCHAPDLSEAAVRHADAVKAAFEGRLTVGALRLAYLLDCVDDVALAVYGDVVDRMAAASGKQVSAAGRRLLLRLQPPAAEPVEDLPFDVALPSVTWAVEVTPQVREAVLDVWRRLDTAVEAVNEALGQRPGGAARWVARFTAEEAEEFLALLPLDDVRVAAGRGTGRRRPGVVGPAPGGWPPELPLSVAVKLLAYVGELPGDRTGSGIPVDVVERVRRSRPDLTLLDVAQHLAPVGVTATDLLLCVTNCARPLAADWPPEAVRTFVAAHLDLVVRLLRGDLPVDPWRLLDVDRARLLALVGTLPQPPARLVPLLLDLALGAAQGGRAAAQDALAALPDRDARIAEALRTGSTAARTAAAGWLARIGDPAAVAGLEAALTRERNDTARVALLEALETLGQDVVQYLDVAGMVARATEDAAKKPPAAVSWLDVDALPAVRWAPGTEHAGQAVPPAVVRLLVVDAVKAKDPTPNALLRRYAALVDPRDRTALGTHLLDAWLAEDLRPVDPQTAAKAAAEQADGWVWAMRSWPQDYVKHPWNGWTKEEITAALLPAESRRPVGSATPSKGLLALVGACGEVPGAARLVERYLKDHQGRRASQAKSLLAVLAMLDDPLATQTLLSVARRFRVQGIQEEAARLAEQVAARRGWSVDELADRTIPTAGFDDDGRMTLSYGPREFTAVLRPDLAVDLLGPDGAPLAALPGVRASDDAEAAAEARRAFAAAKKAVAAVVVQQTDRLHEALVGERVWRFADWSAYLARHTLVRHVVAGLVWRTDDGVLFRPLDDGTLTDADDDAVTVAPDALVRLAHDGVVDAATRDRWLSHLADYAVAPRFPQLGVPPHELTGESRTARCLTDVEGHVLGTFALRNAATRRGWGRGPVHDGPMILSYVKRFPGLRWEAELAFTGEEIGDGGGADEPVALRTLAFHRIVPGRRRETEAWELRPDGEPLGDVPPLLLAECLADARAIAAEGDGFDPDWRRLLGWRP